ncbi:MAG: hypothetical protein Q8R25_02105 [bacterium]|nr:hypothetical protein [bacterium]
MTEKKQKFLDDVQALAREMALEGCIVSFIQLFPLASESLERHGLLIQAADGRYLKVFAQDHAFGIHTSDQFHYSSPWYANDDPLQYVKQALNGFFSYKPKKK